MKFATMSKIEKIAQNTQNGYSKKNNHFLLQFTNYNFYIFTNFDLKLAKGRLSEKSIFLNPNLHIVSKI